MLWEHRRTADRCETIPCEYQWLKGGLQGHGLAGQVWLAALRDLPAH